LENLIIVDGIGFCGLRSSDEVAGFAGLFVDRLREFNGFGDFDKMEKGRKTTAPSMLSL